MLKSLCIKTNNQIADYLLNKFENSKIDNVYLSKLDFKLYTNFIVHYKGNDLNSFFDFFSDILSSTIIKFYEKDIIKHLINSNYFYFTDIEQEKIFDIVNEYLCNGELDDSYIRKDSIIISCIDYFSNNKSVILDGFVNFRLNEYMKIIDYVVDMSVNKFIIDREYTEFIELLKCYINSKKSGINCVHLVYHKKKSILFDESKELINLDKSILNSKFLSDITFSSNDYTLNALLTLLPKKIYIHLIDEIEDEFINTLKLIFNNRVYLCTDCNICKMHRQNLQVEFKKSDINS